MTRPFADILAEARRDNWPNSSIAAMANHHRCGGIARDYVRRCFEDSGSAVTSQLIETRHRT